jgi:trimeric autotransporter adhesin
MDTTNLHFSASRPLDGLGGIVEKARQQLMDFANAPNALDQMLPIFTGADREAVDRALVALKHGDAGLFSRIEVLDDRVLHGARGAYVSNTDTIYLATSLVVNSQTADGLNDAVHTALEEIGHRLDRQLHPGQDTGGDEGELFSSRVLGINLDAATLARINTENDWGTIILNGQEIAVEQDNTLATAKDLGVLSGVKTISDYIGGIDRHDYYRFTLNSVSSIEFLYGSGSFSSEILDVNGQIIPFPVEPIEIGKTLTKGSYYLRISSSNIGAERYSLNIRAVADGAGNTFPTAKDIGILSGTRVFQDFVGGDSIDTIAIDRNDFYRFSLSDVRNFQLSLNGLAANAEVKLFDAGRQLIASSNNSSSNPEALSRVLSAGTYYIRVFAFGAFEVYSEPPIEFNETNYRLTLRADPVVDGAGNTPATAKNIGVLSGTRIFQELVSPTDIHDYYRFSISQNSNFNLSLTGLNADANVRIFNATGQAIAYSTSTGVNSEFINRALAPGIYYANIYNASTFSNYKLTLSAVPFLADNAGNVLARAKNLGLLNNATHTFQDSVSSLDSNDYYKFTLDRAHQITLNLSGLSANADMQILNGNGQAIAFANTTGSTSESINKALNSGTYYLRIYSGINGNTNYKIGLTAKSLLPDSAGNTLAAAKNIGLLNGTRIFQDSVSSLDPNDYYKFTLDRASNCSVYLNGMSGNADLQILNSKGVAIAAGNSSSTEFFNGTLNAGTYYIRIYPALLSNSTNYHLTLSASPNTPFNPAFGYGLVNGAAAVARALGQATPFANVPNLGGNNWGNDLVNAPEAWARGYRGQGITVAVIDSGVDYNHSDLDGNIWVNSREIANNGVDDDLNGYIDDVRGWDFVGNDNDVMDENGHGTHVAGTIAAENNGLGLTGVAYGAKIMPIRVLSYSGGGYQFNIAAGIRYAADNGAKVINLSLGSYYDTPTLNEAIIYASQKGAVVVMAAGNSGTAEPEYPAQIAITHGIAVGAVDYLKQIANSSNRAGANSAMRYVVAPGVDVYSTQLNGGYELLSGTSMATPHVAGVVALMLSANPNLTVSQVRSILTSTASQLV